MPILPDTVSVKGARCILAGLVSAKSDNVSEFEEKLINQLAQNEGILVGKVIQRRGVSRSNKPGGVGRMDAPLDPATYIGKGKAIELAKLVETESANLIVFINPLSSSQILRLEEITQCSVITVAPNE